MRGERVLSYHRPLVRVQPASGKRQGDARAMGVVSFVYYLANTYM